MDENLKTILLIGTPASGKTHYGGQLLGRLNERDCKLKMGTAPESITLFKEVLTCLGNGVPASHTPVSLYEEIKLPIQLPTGQEISLVWPDYGGEQVTHIVKDRQIGEKWRKRLIDSDAWLLFLRLENMRIYEDLLSRPQQVTSTDEPEQENGNFEWSPAAFFIELLQILLYSKGIGTIDKVKIPSLLILLSCWDEIGDKDETTQPWSLLSRRLPLFANYLKSIWEPAYLTVFGLSSLGKSLNNDTPDEDYIDYGPESRGYIILPDGQRDADLTLPILHLMECTK